MEDTKRELIKHPLLIMTAYVAQSLHSCQQLSFPTSLCIVHYHKKL